MRFSTFFFAVLSATTAAAAALSTEKRDADALCLFHGQGCWRRAVVEPTASVVVRAATPEADPEADPLCLFHGQGCWKRDAAAEAAPEADPLCLFHGQGCWKEKREAAPIAAPAADAEADPLCLFHGQGCWKEKREAAPIAAPAADAEADPLCLFHGQGCWKAKRDAAPAPSPEALCLFHGQGCWKVKRSVYAFANAVRSMAGAPETRAAEISNQIGGAAFNAKRAVNEIAQLLAGRTADPVKYLENLSLVARFGTDSATTHAVEKRDVISEVDKRLCLFHGQGCWKREAAASVPAGSVADKRACSAPGAACDIARRAAEALVAEIENFRAPEKRAEVLEERLCLFHGQGCWKRDTVEDLVTRCNAPGGACDNAARDLKVMHTAARALLDYVNDV